MKEITIPQAKIAPRSDPKHLKLTPLWKCEDVKKPGNILVVPGFGGAPRLAIIDSWNAIAEVGLNGKLLAPPHKLDIQNGEVVSYLRTAVGANGKRLFAGSAMGQQRLHLFDENWNRLMSYPEAPWRTAIAASPTCNWPTSRATASCGCTSATSAWSASRRPRWRANAWPSIAC